MNDAIMYLIEEGYVKSSITEIGSIPDGCGIYIGFSDEPLYVGQSRNMRLRLRQHRYGSSWFHHVTLIMWKAFPQKELSKEEARIILLLDPAVNQYAGDSLPSRLAGPERIKGKVGRPVKLFTCNTCSAVIGAAAVRKHKCTS